MPFAENLRRVAPGIFSSENAFPLPPVPDAFGFGELLPPSGFPQLLISPIESPSSLFFLFYHCCLFTCEEIPSIPPTEHNFRSPTGSSIDLISLSRRSLVPSTSAPLPNFRLQARNTREKRNGKVFATGKPGKRTLPKNWLLHLPRCPSRDRWDT